MVNPLLCMRVGGNKITAYKYTNPTIYSFMDIKDIDSRECCHTEEKIWQHLLSDNNTKVIIIGYHGNFLKSNKRNATNNNYYGVANKK